MVEIKIGNATHYIMAFSPIKTWKGGRVTAPKYRAHQHAASIWCPFNESSPLCVCLWKRLMPSPDPIQCGNSPFLQNDRLNEFEYFNVEVDVARLQGSIGGARLRKATYSQIGNSRVWNIGNVIGIKCNAKITASLGFDLHSSKALRISHVFCHSYSICRKFNNSAKPIHLLREGSNANLVFILHYVHPLTIDDPQQRVALEHSSRYWIDSDGIGLKKSVAYILLMLKRAF
ncbi:uncharacterized protein BDR25DRAFT_350954 [Lindgomyces ingoldianus]|uniref:Uncharacterized protein n=1 Tax=Lindgomyces ingoldianus TaxID=673940 RepID=A0ACB6R970_9PLEO|nr:uncharacterized protein BDR25DRAFT_350954 [Lindgomyces ingoldianus]KAF2475590.1 hypothetical protein BDR25DRAFT_350954 [Lindgomyces ingoldianus]